MELEYLRQQIDEIDNRMVLLFEDRMALSGEISKWKQENNMPVGDNCREQDILNRITKLVRQEHEVYIKSFYSNIFSLSRTYQSMRANKETGLSHSIKNALANTPPQLPENAVVACQGVRGAYSQIACQSFFEEPEILYFKNFQGVFRAVESGLCRYGILPIENSSYGSVTQVYDLMKKHNFYIVASHKLKINHVLLAKGAKRLSDIKEIYSHEQAIGQCSDFLQGLRDTKTTVAENTAAAARMVSESDRGDIAAISSENCAQLYGLTCIKRNIQNSGNNFTRFICISKAAEIYPNTDKISLMLSVPHRPGSLFEIISAFSSLRLNLTKLESRPISGTDFEFMFYFDFEGSVTDTNVIRLLERLSGECEKFAFLGNYSESAG